MEGRRVEELLLADFFNESKPLVFLAPFAFGAIVLRQKQKVVRLRDATTIPKTSCHWEAVPFQRWWLLKLHNRILNMENYDCLSCTLELFELWQLNRSKRNEGRARNASSHKSIHPTHTHTHWIVGRKVASEDGRADWLGHIRNVFRQQGWLTLVWTISGMLSINWLD